jgi:hypothetical protein
VPILCFERVRERREYFAAQRLLERAPQDVDQERLRSGGVNVPFEIGQDFVPRPVEKRRRERNKRRLAELDFKWQYAVRHGRN